MKKITRHSSATAHHTPAAPSAHPHGAAPHAAHPATPADPAEAALKSFLQPATPDPTHAHDTHQFPQTVNPKPQTSSPHSPPWSADLAALETKHHAALRALATQHQSTLAALEQRCQAALSTVEGRLAAAEHTTANLSGQLRELR